MRHAAGAARGGTRQTAVARQPHDGGVTSIDDDASRKAAPLTMRSLDQVEDYFMPFDLEVDGFTDGW